MSGYNLPKDVKDRWVAALRSGDYKQAKSRLVEKIDSGVAMCCLGVLCDIVKENFGIELVSVTGMDQVKFTINGESWGGEMLPYEIAERWFGQDHSPAVKIKYDEGFTNSEMLSELNDTGKSFSEIADLIEEQF